jgi:hypothetical protein
MRACGAGPGSGTRKFTLWRVLTELDNVAADASIGQRMIDQAFPGSSEHGHRPQPDRLDPREPDAAARRSGGVTQIGPVNGWWSPREARLAGS